MIRQILDAWDDAQWEQAYAELKIPAWKPPKSVYNGGERLALKTLTGHVHHLEVPDHTDHLQREAMENAFLEKLKIAGETQVLLCYNTLGGDHPSMISGNLRHGLLALDEGNLDTVVFLWGGCETILAKPLRDMLPPKK